MLPGEVQLIALHKPPGNSLYFIFQLAKQLKALKPDGEPGFIEIEKKTHPEK